MQLNAIEIKVQRVHKFDDNKPLKAFADIVVNESLMIKGLRVVKGKSGLFVSMPHQLGKDKKWYDSVLCLSDEVKFKISQEVLSAYQNN